MSFEDHAQTGAPAARSAPRARRPDRTSPTPATPPRPRRRGQPDRHPHGVAPRYITTLPTTQRDPCKPRGNGGTESVPALHVTVAVRRKEKRGGIGDTVIGPARSDRPGGEPARDLFARQSGSPRSYARRASVLDADASSVEVDAPAPMAMSPLCTPADFASAGLGARTGRPEIRNAIGVCCW